MAAGMAMQMKMSALGLMMQLKGLLLSLVAVSVALVQFFWRLQERQQHKEHQPSSSSAADWRRRYSLEHARDDQAQWHAYAAHATRNTAR